MLARDALRLFSRLRLIEARDAERLSWRLALRLIEAREAERLSSRLTDRDALMLRLPDRLVERDLLMLLLPLLLTDLLPDRLRE